jgi:hypothetical protein
LFVLDLLLVICDVTPLTRESDASVWALVGPELRGVPSGDESSLDCLPNSFAFKSLTLFVAERLLTPSKLLGFVLLMESGE